MPNPQTAAVPRNKDDFAVVVGINAYPYIGTLNGAENDAGEFRDWLEAPSGGNLDPANITSFLSEGGHANPRPIDDDIDTALTTLINQGNKKGGRMGRRLYLFFAGHGFGSAWDSAALLMANASQLLPCHIPGRPYAAYFCAGSLFDEVIMFMDCCRNSIPGVSTRLPIWAPGNPGAGGKHLFGFAVKANRSAREFPFPPSGRHFGVFSRALMEGLRGRAVDAQGKITAASLESYVYLRIKELAGELVQAGKLGSDMTGEVEPKFDYDSALVISNHIPRVGTRVIIRTSVPNQQLVLLDGSLQPLPLPPAASGEITVTLAPGLYILKNTALARSLTLEVGGTEVNAAF